MSGKEELMFTINPKVDNAERQYCFTKFTVNLNYIDEEMKKWLPPTDARLRPD